MDQTTFKKITDDDDAAYYDMRRRWLDYICEQTHLSDKAFRIGYWLGKRMNAEKRCCWYTHKQIAKKFTISVDKVSRAIAELEAETVLIVVRSHRQPNRYSIRLPFNF